MNRTADGRTVSTVPASPLVYPGNKTRGYTLSDYRICQFTQGAIQLGNSLIRNLAGFAFQQIMDSPEIGLVCPGLKESLVVLSALPALVTANQACLDGEVRCSDKCIQKNRVCDVIFDCTDKSNEGTYCSERLSQCKENKQDNFICNNTKQCIPINWTCDSLDDCADGSDEAEALCDSVPSSPVRPMPIFFAMFGGLCCALLVSKYCRAVYLSVKALRTTNPEASTCRLLQMASVKPFYYRFPHQPVPIDTRQDDITPSASERPGQRPEAQRAVHPQAMHLPAVNQQAAELPTYQQATELPTYQQATELSTFRQAAELPTYQQAIELSTFQQASEPPTYQQATRGLPTYREAIDETLV
ncbi:hypothetical protein J7438_21840 [Thalassotalea sp. G20_0]|uniref:LDL receptor domain-containing protein n=1 Tax=Thalassotalea sp. G20_0 TaxID=2821093 RepID=UPI001ADA1C73|nr:hypothetical protein [Thalassotalea sp. G20_0]MBO9496705.1 hypothetical protein [Thalassotalea sp. G20_0]